MAIQAKETKTSTRVKPEWLEILTSNSDPSHICHRQSALTFAGHGKIDTHGRKPSSRTPWHSSGVETEAGTTAYRDPAKILGDIHLVDYRFVNPKAAGIVIIPEDRIDIPRYINTMTHMFFHGEHFRLFDMAHELSCRRRCLLPFELA